MGGILSSAEKSPGNEVAYVAKLDLWDQGMFKMATQITYNPVANYYNCLKGKYGLENVSLNY